MASVLQSIKVNAAVKVSGSATTYTAPATGYAILTLVGGSGGDSFTINGVSFAVTTGAFTQVYVGPSQTVKGNNSDDEFFGVEFINTT